MKIAKEFGFFYLIVGELLGLTLLVIGIGAVLHKKLGWPLWSVTFIGIPVFFGEMWRIVGLAKRAQTKESSSGPET